MSTKRDKAAPATRFDQPKLDDETKDAALALLAEGAQRYLEELEAEGRTFEQDQAEKRQKGQAA